MLTITFFKNPITQYDVLHFFRDSLAKGLEKNGVKTHLVDLSDIKSLYANPPDYTLAFNGLHPSSKGDFLADELEIPHIAWLVDSAYYFYSLAKCPLNILITPDQRSSDLFTEWGSKTAHFLPHAFDEDLAFNSSDRPLPLVFLGSLMDPIEMEELWKRHMPPAVVKSLMEAAEETLKIPEMTYQRAYESLMKEHDSFFAPLTPPQIADIGTTLDRYVRAKDRIELLQSLEGLPVHIYGNCLSKRSWGDFIDPSSFTISPGVAFSEAIEIMKKAEIVINSSPMFKTGAHERIFYGLGLGAAVLTNETPWVKTHFPSDEILLHGQRERLEVLLAHPEQLREMVAKGQERVLKEHTWGVRAKQLIKLIS